MILYNSRFQLTDLHANFTNYNSFNIPSHYSLKCVPFLYFLLFKVEGNLGIRAQNLCHPPIQIVIIRKVIITKQRPLQFVHMKVWNMKCTNLLTPLRESVGTT